MRPIRGKIEVTRRTDRNIYTHRYNDRDLDIMTMTDLCAAVVKLKNLTKSN